MDITADQKAAWHILQLAEQGRLVEVIAQMISSYVISGGNSGEEFHAVLNMISKRTVDLMLNPEEIWAGLLPGGPAVEFLDGLIVAKEVTY